MFSINTTGSPRRLAQRDTEAYWRALLRSGGTDINANGEITRIHEFLRGCYELARRDNWFFATLRSTQNNGTGVVAESLGGLARRLVLTNGPTWGGLGITNPTASAFVRLSPDYTLSQATASLGMFFAKTTVGSETGRAWAADAAGTFRGLGFDAFPATQYRFLGNATLNFGAQSTSFTSVAVGAGSSSFHAQDSTYQALSVGPVLLPGGTLRMEEVGNSMLATRAAVWFLAGAMTHPDYLAFYNLYKSTLGVGLGLP